MKKIKFFSLICAIALTLSVFSACSGRQSDTRTFTYEEIMTKYEGDIERGAVIRVLDNQMAVESKHLEKIMNAFNEKYKEYNVTAVDANMDQYVDLEKNGPDGYGPDVLHQANDMLMRYAENQHVYPIPMDKIEGVDKIPQLAMDAYYKKTYDLDLYYGVPVALQSTVLTYRKDLLPSNWTSEWDKNTNNIPDMIENINDLYKYSLQVRTESGNKKHGLFMSLLDQFFNTGYLISYGAYVFGETTDDIGLNAEGAEKGLNLFRDLAGALGSECITQDATVQVADYMASASGSVFATIGTPDWLTTFQKNLAKTYRNQGHSTADAKRMAEENLVVVAPPRLPKDGNIKKDITNLEEETFAAKTMGGVNAFGISAYTKFPKASLAFVQFVSEYSNLKLRADDLGAVPARSDLAEELQGVSQMINGRVSAENIYMMPSTRATMYIWPSLASLYNDVATDNTTRPIPKYLTPESLKAVLSKTVVEIKEAMSMTKD